MIHSKVHSSTLPIIVLSKLLDHGHLVSMLFSK